MKVAILTGLAFLAAAPPAQAQESSNPEAARRGTAALAAGSTCNFQGDCFTQYGVRLTALRPGHIGPDVAALFGNTETGTLDGWFLMDFSVSHAGQLGSGVFLLPRAGLSVGSFYALVAHVGAGLMFVLWDNVVLRLDATYRNLWIGQFGVGDFSLGTLTLGIGAI